MYCPGFVATNLSKKKESIFVPSPERATKGALQELGSKKVIYGIVWHELLSYLFEMGKAYTEGPMKYF